MTTPAKKAAKKAKVGRTPGTAEQLARARSHLERVQRAWSIPDWSDLTIYGMYAIEAGILAAAAHLKRDVKKTHWDKADFALELATTHGLPDVSDLVRALNTGRKATAYGDEDMPEDELGDPEDLAAAIDEFIEAVAVLLAGKK